MVPFHIIIPARLASKRLPNKLLMDLDGMPIIEHVYRRACAANPTSVVIATDDMYMVEIVEGFGGKAILTSNQHLCGTDRIAEVIALLDFNPNDIIVNVQGDEPFMASASIIKVAECLANTVCPVATLYYPLAQNGWHNPGICKVVFDGCGKALYFSRSLIPACRDAEYYTSLPVYRHMGLYAYRASFLKIWPTLSPAPLEIYESLEQLRILFHGYAIQLDQAPVAPQLEINTMEDLLEARKIIEADIEVNG